LLVAAGEVDLAAVGWSTDDGLPLRFDVDQLPLAEGRFSFRLGLTDRDDGRLLHQLDRAAEFVVYPGGDERGQIRLEGRWGRKEVGAAAELRTK
jgi:hypothetical protein